MTAGNRWGRAIGAGVLVGAALLVMAFLAMVLYALLVSRKADLMTFGHSFSQWNAVIGGPLLTFLLVRWALRPLKSAHMAHALVVAGIAVAIHILVFASQANEGHASWWIFVLAYALMVAGAIAAAKVARRNVDESPRPTSPPTATA